jgi:ABC-type multidrug transport system ATPase subunit
VSVRSVRRTFSSVVAVEEMSFDVPPGAVTALVGPNGSGKTTLLLMLATLLRPDAGRISVAGHDPVTAPREVRRLMGWMPDTFGTYDNLTAREVLQFVAAAYRMPRSAQLRRTTELLDLVHLSEYADRPVHVLSRGQKQRLGLARAIVHSPSVLLLDEPASGLDPGSRVELRTLLRGMAAAGTAVLVSSHILTDLDQTADRAVFVAGGRIVAEQTVSELRTTDDPAPWRIRALQPERLLAMLTHYGVTIGPIDDSGVQIVLRGDNDAAALLAALLRDGVPVAALAPLGSALESKYLAINERDR